MIKRWWWCGALILGMTLSGCGGGAVNDPGPAPVPDAPPPATLGDHVDVSLAELVNRPREELANLADELLAKVRVQEKAHRESKQLFLLLPELHLPLALPVLCEAHYSPRVGCSLPPYLPEGTTDNALALHLARHGDVEAARLLADPANAAVRAQIDACATGRNYPVEWTRYVALLLHAAQLRMAAGEVEGATEVVLFHRQLRDLLDEKAARGPLGAVLLSAGRETLTLAGDAWREDQQTTLADQIHEALEAWGDVARPGLAVPLGASHEEVAALLGGKDQGRLLVPASVGRFLDLLALPMPAENTDAAYAFFDGNNRLSEVLLLYHMKVSEYFPEPADLAWVLRDQLPANASGRRVTLEDINRGLRRTLYSVGDLTCDITLVPRNCTVGGLVRVRPARAADQNGAATLSRDLGVLHLDRSLEQNRLRLAPEQRADLLRVDRPETLANVTNPLSMLHLEQVTLQAVPGQDLVSRVLLRYEIPPTPVPLAQLALPLWNVAGAGRIDGVDDDQGGHLSLSWEDVRTRYTLRLPNRNDDPIELEVADREPPTALAERLARAESQDRSERKARFAAGKLFTRLPRFLEWQPIQLGMKKEEVQQVLPGGKTVLPGKLSDGLMLVFIGDAAPNVACTPRQLFLRFDTSDRLVEIRVRYQDTTPGNGPARGLTTLLAGLKKRGGAPVEYPAPWAKLWPDLTVRKPTPVLNVWRDDTTLLTYQADSGGAEVVVRDCPVDQETGVALPPLEYLSRGPQNCNLGDSREELLKRWGIKQPVTVAEGALVLTPKQPGPYDALLVWCDRGRVVRIVARHTQPGPAADQPAQLTAALNAAWSRDLAGLGWPRRQDATAGEAAASFGWHDERTRVRLFWQESEQGPTRLYTEWKGLR